MAGYGIIDSITSSLAPIHRDGHKFVALAALVTFIFFFIWSPLGWIGLVITLYIAYFFRDPERVTPLREGLIISPADGRVSLIEKVVPPAELELGAVPLTRISIFLSVLDVHINRCPVAGQITNSVYTPGLFLNANLDKASEDNERRSLVITMTSGQKVGVVQIAGLIARRILTFADKGDLVGVGERFGLIRFGSRVDVYLPEGHTALVSVGQIAIGGETILADLKSSEGEREARLG